MRRPPVSILFALVLLLPLMTVPDAGRAGSLADRADRSHPVEPAGGAPMAPAGLPSPYPAAPRGPVVDDYHGVKVADPYRWLEDPDSRETRAWIEAENRVTEGYLGKVLDRDAIRHRLTELWNFERYGIPFKEGGRYFLSKNDGLQNQSVLYTMKSLDDTPRLLLDPNTLSADGTVALTDVSVSHDGKLMAYGLASGGSDWQDWKVRNIETGRDLADTLHWIKFSSAAWTHDGRGFFYSRYDEPKAGRSLEDANYNHKLYYHRLGAPQDKDDLIYERPDRKDLGFIAFVTDDGRYLVINVWQGTKIENGLYYKDLATPGSPVVRLLDDFDASYAFVENDGPVFWLVTNYLAPRRRVIAIDTRNPARDHWRELVPQAAETLEGASCVGGRFVVSYLEDAHSRVRFFDLGGRFLSDLALPGLGTANGFGGKRRETETFYSFTSYTDPGTIFRYDLATGASTVFRRAPVRFDPSLYETRQVFFASKDGTRVPMFITARKGLKLDGSHPTYLHGYGGFGVAQTPAFSVPEIVWMERGGVYAVANLRGGGEYGEDWHRAGMGAKRQNVFDDFIAAGEWLIESGYTTKKLLAIGGESNGGLLTAACMVQRPDLFGAVKVGVGVLDMLRFHKFTIGWGWTSDYGSPDDVEGFKTLFAYSPYHNLKPGTAYPPTLITTADHDDRVVPAHSFKFATALQHAQAGPSPVLIRIETRAGHGGGKPVAKVIDQSADELAFLTAALRTS
jgi:prolyl oligopeptidase